MNFGRNNPENKKNLESAYQQEGQENQEFEQKNSEENKPVEQEENESKSYTMVEEDENRPNAIDGWKTIEHDMMPNGGVFYPSSWNFAYRCPKAKEVINFSTVNNDDTAAIYTITEDLIRKCVKIWDSDENKEISPAEINDNDRLFFMMRLREFYIPDENQSIKLNHMCPSCLEEHEELFKSDSLIFKVPNDALIEAFDGRIFTLDMDGIEIKFRIPTIGTVGRLYKHIVQTIRDRQNQKRANEGRRDTKYVTDKVFLKTAPFLFITGKETVQDIIQKYKKIENDGKILEVYSSIIDFIKLENMEYINTTCPHCGAEDTVDISFPGWKSFFNKFIDKKGYFSSN